MEYSTTTLDSSLSVLGKYTREDWYFFKGVTLDVYLYLIGTIFFSGVLIYFSNEERSKLIYTLFKVIGTLFFMSETPYKKIITKILEMMMLIFSIIFITIFSAKIFGKVKHMKYFNNIHSIFDM